MFFQRTSVFVHNQGSGWSDLDNKVVLCPAKRGSIMWAVPHHGLIPRVRGLDTSLLFLLGRDKGADGCFSLFASLAAAVGE